MTRQGRLACLTNFREPESAAASDISGLQSRGAIALAHLTVPPETREAPEEAAERILALDGIHHVGGFSLMFGKLSRPGPGGKRAPLAVVSNRTPDAKAVAWVAGQAGEVHGLSNAHFGDGGWPKISSGEALLREVLEANVSNGEDEDQLVKKLFQILSVDTLPARQEGQKWDTVVQQLRNSIFIPPLRSASEAAEAGEKSIVGPEMGDKAAGWYATHQQTVILVDMNGHVKFVERTLYTAGDEDTRRFEFDIEGW